MAYTAIKTFANAVQNETVPFILCSVLVPLGKPFVSKTSFFQLSSNLLLPKKREADQHGYFCSLR